MRTRTLFSGVSSASRPVFAVVMGAPFVAPGVGARKRSARFGIEKDVQRLDPARLDLGDVRAGDGGRTARRTCSPTQPSKAVMTDGNSIRGKRELRRHASEERVHGTADRVSARKHVVGLKQFGISRIKFLECSAAAAAIPLTEDTN